MKWFKRIFLSLLVLIVLLIGGVAAFVATFNPNAYKGQIEALVKEKTGRTLTLGGNIKLAFYPWLGLRMNDVSLGNPPGFGKQPFVKVQQLSLYVELLPLLKRHVIVKQIDIQGLNLDLKTKANGQNNWRDLLAHSARESALNHSPAIKNAQSNPAVAAAGAPFVLSVAGVAVNDASINWTNLQTGSQFVLAPVNLTVGRIGQGKESPLTLSFQVQKSPSSLTGDGKLTALLSVDLAKSRYSMRKLVFDLDIKGGHLPPGGLKAGITGDLLVDAAGGGQVRFAPFSLALGHTQIAGSATLSDLSSPLVQFKLHSPEINVDHVLALMNAVDSKPASVQPAPVSASAPPAVENTPIRLPVALLRKMRMNGDIRIDRLLMQKLELKSVQAVLTSRQGLMQMNPVTASVYGGSLKGNASLDVRGAIPRYALGTEVQGVQLSDLLKDYLGHRYMTGLAGFDATLTTAGDTVDGLTRGLNGRLAWAVKRGSFQNSRLAQQIQALLAILNKNAGASSPKGVEFASLTGTARVNSGIIDNRDLLLQAILFKATGAGTIDLPAQKVDYVLRFEKMQGRGAVIPLKIYGSLDAPKYRIELAAMLQNEAKQKLRQKLNQQRQKLENKVKNELMKNLNKLF